MGVRVYKPTSAGRRHGSVNDYAELTRSRPEKSLCKRIGKSSGRNHHGVITARHRGGGARRIYRLIDFKRNKDDIPAKVASIEYDPNRNCFISLLHYADGEKRYILAPQNLKVGDEVLSAEKADIRPGNAMKLRHIPLGTLLHNIELKEGKGGQLVRSAGGYAQLMAKEGGYATLRLPSGEIRMVHLECRATIGQLGNTHHEIVSLGKAGRKRWLGQRPNVRGVAMNPVDHPMGGGEGKSSGGRHPCTPWGKPTKGYKTRKKNKISDRYIVKKRS